MHFVFLFIFASRAQLRNIFQLKFWCVILFFLNIYNNAIKECCRKPYKTNHITNTYSKLFQNGENITATMTMAVFGKKNKIEIKKWNFIECTYVYDRELLERVMRPTPNEQLIFTFNRLYKTTNNKMYIGHIKNTSWCRLDTTYSSKRDIIFNYLDK